MATIVTNLVEAAHYILSGSIYAVDISTFIVSRNVHQLPAVKHLQHCMFNPPSFLMGIQHPGIILSRLQPFENEINVSVCGMGAVQIERGKLEVT